MPFRSYKQTKDMEQRKQTEQEEIDDLQKQYEEDVEAEFSKSPRELKKEQKLKKKALKKKQKNFDKTVRIGKGFINKVTPRKYYKFYSDYFRIDGSYATILTVFNRDGSDDALSPMWGIDLIPRNLGEGVVARLLIQTNNAEQKWVDQQLNSADRNTKIETDNANSSGSTKEAVAVKNKRQDVVQIAQDLQNGDSYMHVAFKVFIKAPTMYALDTAVSRLTSDYDARFGAVHVAGYDGRQKDDLANLFRSGEEQIGTNYMFTSSEYAGQYNLLTHGIEDPDGEFIGRMKADVNTSAVFCNLNGFNSHVIVATENRGALLGYPQELMKGIKSSTIWGIKLSQVALLNNHRVVHFILNGADLNLGADLSDITSEISMSKGDINPFEMFGEIEDELDIFASHLEKWRLMLQQIDPKISDSALPVLERELSYFYIRERMWVQNAKENRKDLRIVNLPHNEVPTLNKFVPYLNEHFSSLLTAHVQDTEELKDIRRIKDIFNSLLRNNSDLFDTVTSSGVDEASTAPRVVYDFSSLMLRGKGIAMAQFVNALSFATRSLKDGDVVVLHGAELIDKGVRDYVKESFSRLKKNRVRIAYLYDDVEAMLSDTELNRMTYADWVLTGRMPKASLKLYEKILDTKVPQSLATAITMEGDKNYYLRRGLDNIIFEADLALE